MLLKSVGWLLLACILGVRGKPPVTYTYEEMTYLDNHIVRVGINLQLGGSITYLSSYKNEVNLINNYDFGRQVQMSFYSGPTPYEPDGNKAHASWQFLGWNPIQSGDWAGNRSKVLEYKNDGKQLYVKCIPMHWPLNNVPGECSFETWITLEKNVVKVRARLNNNRPDTTMYKERSQELPAVYTIPELNTLMTYKGSAPFANDSLTVIENSNVFDQPIKWSYWNATENWAAFVNADQWGLGVLSPEVQTFCGGFYGDQKKASGGSLSPSTGYISPISNEVLDHNIQFEYKYALMVDSVENIRAYAKKNYSNTKSILYHFDTNRQHFIYENTRDAGWPIKGGLDLALMPGAAIVSPYRIFELRPDSYVELKAAYNTSAKKGKLMVEFFDKPGYSSEVMVPFDIKSNGRLTSYKLPLGLYSKHDSRIVRIKIILAEAETKPGDCCKIEFVKMWY